MTAPKPRRKLAAILAADVVNFSAMMGDDEDGTLRNLKACRALTDESITADMAAELKVHGVHAVTLYPGAGVTEITAFPGGETPVFTGRAVGALLNKASKETLERYSGKVIQTAELATDYSFTDVGGEMPDGPFSGIEAGKRCREAMSQPIFQYNLDGELPDLMETNNTEIAGLFPGA